MKAGQFITSLFLAITLFFSACSAGSGYTKDIRKLNENSNLDFKLAEDEANLDYKDKYEWVYGFGGYRLRSADDKTSYSVSGYPDCLDSYKVPGL